MWDIGDFILKLYALFMTIYVITILCDNTLGYIDRDIWLQVINVSQVLLPLMETV